MFLISSDKFKRTIPPPPMPLLICMPRSATKGDISHGLLPRLELMTLEYERKYIKANVVMRGFVGESLLSKSADAASAAYKLRKKKITLLYVIIRRLPSALGVLISSQRITLSKIM